MNIQSSAIAPSPRARAESARIDARTEEPGQAGRRRMRPTRWAGIAFVAPLLVYLVVLYVYPLYENFSMSLHRFSRATFVTGTAPFVGFDVYHEIISSPQFWTTVRQTAFFVVVSLVFQYAIGLGLALFFRRAFPLSRLLRALFLVPWLLPIIVSATTWQWMMDADSGIINRALSVFGVDPVWWLNAQHSLTSVTIANIWLGIPFNLVILYSGLEGIQANLYEAAEMDGASAWHKFWHITFPLLRPVTAITLLLGFVYTLKVVDIIWIMTAGTGTSQTLATWAYGMAFGKGASSIIRYSQASVVGTILLLIALLMGFVYLFVQRRQED
jgi:multiple sugar transport system permease protein